MEVFLMKHSIVKMSMGLLFAGAFLLAGCKSTDTKVSKSVTTEIIDFRGAEFSTEPAAWVKTAVMENAVDKETLPSSVQDQLAGKHYIITVTDGTANQALNVVETRAKAKYLQDIALSLNAIVVTQVSADNADADELTSAAAVAEFTGFSKVTESWVQKRVTDKTKKTTKDVYSFIAIYACDNTLWQQQAADYARKIGQQTQSENLKKATERADSIAEAAMAQNGVVVATELE